MSYYQKHFLINGVSRVDPNERSFEMVDYFVKKLRDNATFARDFSQIRFSDYEQKKVREQQIVQFEVDAKIEKKKQKKRGKK